MPRPSPPSLAQEFAPDNIRVVGIAPGIGGL
jgi:NAD(P)-dependent dehydrogenase (short-subunit alcohol dehydrogenase family)